MTGRTVVFAASSWACSSSPSAPSPRLGRSGYYVGFVGDQVAVFKGRPGGVLWVDPTLDRHRAHRAPSSRRRSRAVADHPTFSSSLAARQYVERLADDPRALTATTTTTTVAEPTTTAASTAARRRRAR